MAKQFIGYVKTSKGEKIDNAIVFNTELAEKMGFKLTDAKAVKDISSEEKKGRSDLWEQYLVNFHNQLTNKTTDIMNLENRQFSKSFCQAVVQGDIPQFQKKKDFFQRRALSIENAQVYKFKDKFAQLLVEKNSNESGFRRMPFDNMFIEIFFEFPNGHTINGIHITRAMLDESGARMMSFADYDEKKFPDIFTKEAISIFFVGYDGEDANHYNYFSLDKNDTIDFEKRKKKSLYACPFCNIPMKKLSKTEHTCVSKDCIKYYTKKNIVYDVNDKNVAEYLEVMRSDTLYTLEDFVRNFVSNLLDFLTNKEVVVRSFMTEEEREKRNEKRIKRGKHALPPIKVVEVSGFLNKYVGQIRREYNDNLVEARKGSEHWVQGHFMRFWNRKKYTRLYDIVDNSKTIKEIKEKLAKFVRYDDKNKPLPPSQQYEYDEEYDVVRVWKLPSLRNKGKGKDKRQIVNLVEVEK